MNEAERLTFLATHYNRLQGLRFAPLYVFFIASPWTDFNGVSIPDACIFVGFCIAWFWLSNRYYREHYGQTKEMLGWDGWEFGNFARLTLFAYALLGFYFIIVRSQVDVPLVFSFLFVSVGGILSEGLLYSKLALRRAYYVVGAIIALSALLSVSVSGMPGHRFLTTYYLTLLGAIMLTLSIFDHLLLVHMFRPSRTLHA